MSAVNIINAGGGAGVLAASLLPVSQRKISSLITGGGFKVVVSGAVATPVSAVSSDHQQTRSSSTTSTCSQNHMIGITTSFEDKSESTETSPRKQYSNSNSKSENISIIKTVNHHDIQVQRLSFKDYLEQSKNMMMTTTSDGTGPPRWFSPLECASPAHHFPLLLFLPGLDGVGLGLILHHQRLGQMFDIWCLHIPIMDRTPFTELVNLVERTVKSENYRSPKRPIYLVGESLGGCLALAVAARNPDIDLVIIASNPATCFSKSQLQPILPLLKLMPPQFHLSVPYLLSLMTGAPSRMVTATVEKGLPLQQTVGELSQSFTALSSYLSVLASVLPGETLLWKLQMLKSASTYANSRLHAVKAQTLILSSGRDQLLPSQEEGERLRHILPNCQTRLFSESGHALFLEDGIDLVTVIKGASFYRRARYLNYVSDYMPPSPSEFKKIRDSVRWIEEVTCSVMLSTLENGQIVKGFSGIPSDGPVLLVGYHMLYGLELVPMVTRLWAERQILLRGLAHPMMYNNLKDDELLDLSNFDILRVMGAVPVSGKNFFRLLSSKSHVLLYPGGMREAVHRKGEEYKLFWPEQSEFVRMAARFGAKIIPFGVVGEDDFGQVVFDYNDQVKIPFLKAYYEEVTNRAVRLRTDTEGEAGKQALHLPVILPKFPGRFYYYFGKPIETAGRKQELSSRSRGQELYLEIKSEVERCLAYLKEKREKDPYRNILARLVYQATHGFDSEVPTFEL